ncbi:MAG: hypothetical protein M4579_003135 [Chaenotheca gracillima]|nr:MAG: hypothetical protein M4579_003135 [Chaenotheca gracillima]
MAELILGAVSFGLAGPGVVLAFCKCGRYITEKIDSLKNAPLIAQQLKTFGYDLHAGQLKADIELACWALTLEDLDTSLRVSLDDHIERLRAGLLTADRKLSKLFDKNGEVRSGYFFIVGERNVSEAVETLRKWQADFVGLISLIEMRNRVNQDQMLLSSDKFKMIWQYPSQYCTQLEDVSHVYLGKAEVLYSTRREIPVLLERRDYDKYADTKEMKEVASYLAGRLAKKPLRRGILKCLGYRAIPRLELIFEVPNGLGHPRNLKSVIAAGPYRSLNDRMHLARQISEAVLLVHRSELVHKNIRPDTVLVFPKDSDFESESISTSADLDLLVLTDWSMLREASGVSSRRSEQDLLKNLYRHPHRQSLQIERRYNMGHDIYSLGVCLLEIGLWQPLIASGDGESTLSNLYQETAVSLDLVRPENSTSVKELTSNPLVVQQVLQGLASRELPQRMGLTFTKVVVACLTCLEGGFGESSIFEMEKQTAAGLKFSDFVLQPLSNISL